MNSAELQLGNYVYCNLTQFPMYVVGIVGDTLYLNFKGNEGGEWEVNAKDVMPIEVTEELLKKLGFEKNDIVIDNILADTTYDMQLKSFFIEISTHSNSDKKTWYCQIDNGRNESIGGFDFQYLHQLQNGIRLITNLEINLWQQ